MRTLGFCKLSIYVEGCVVKKKKKSEIILFYLILFALIETSFRKTVCFGYSCFLTGFLKG